MASSIAAITMLRSIDFSRATASAICSSSSLLALTAAMGSFSFDGIDVAPPRTVGGQTMFFGVLRQRFLGGLRSLEFRLRRKALLRIAALGMRRRRRRQTELALH